MTDMAKRHRGRSIPKTKGTSPLAGLTTFRIPEPKGEKINLASIPKSTRYVPPVDPDEEAAFGVVAGTRGTRRSGRRVPVDASDEDAMTPAQRRMVGRPGGLQETRSERELEHDDDEEPESDEAEDEEPEADDDGTRDDDILDDGRVVSAAPAHAPTLMGGRGPFTMPAHVTPAEPVFDPRVFATSAPIYTRPIGLADTDRLWDWIRRDKDQGKAFFGQVFESSVSLHTFMGRLSQAEQYGVALIRAIAFDDDANQSIQHLGFVCCSPILADMKTALVHIYLREDQRGSLANYIRPLVEIAEQTMPGYRLAIASMNAAFVKLHRQVLAPLGFVEHTMFVR